MPILTIFLVHDNSLQLCTVYGFVVTIIISKKFIFGRDGVFILITVILKKKTKQVKEPRPNSSANL